MNTGEYTDTESQLLAARLKHTISLLENRIIAAEANAQHYRELANLRLSTLEAQTEDYESRLRSLQDASTQFKLLASLATGGGILSIISLIRTLVQ